MNQDELKALVGQAARQYVVPGQVVGVGTGSTVNQFIEALAFMKDQIKGAVSSSEASTARLKALGIPVFDSNEVAELAVYIDAALINQLHWGLNSQIPSGMKVQFLTPLPPAWFSVGRCLAHTVLCRAHHVGP